MSRGCDKALIKSALVVLPASAPEPADIRGAELKRLIFDGAGTAENDCLGTPAHQWDKLSCFVRLHDLLPQSNRSLRDRLCTIALLQGRGGLADSPSARAGLVPQQQAEKQGIGFGKAGIARCSILMLSGRQCSAPSTTGRVQEFGDSTAFRSDQRLPSLPLPSLLKCSAHVIRKPCQASLRFQRQRLSLQPICSSKRHRQYRCCHSPTTACAAASAHTGPDSSRPPSLLRNIRTAAILAAVFGIWCCISANTQPTSAFLSVTTALTDAGAPPAGGELWHNSLHVVLESPSPADDDNSVAPNLQLHKEQSEVAMLALRLGACTLSLA